MVVSTVEKKETRKLDPRIEHLLWLILDAREARRRQTAQKAD